MSRIRLAMASALVASGAAVALAAGPLSSASAGVALSQYVCQGSQVTLFDNTNGLNVSNGGADPVFSTNNKPYCLTYLQTYHWNNGRGSTPGHLSLIRVSGPKGLAPLTHFYAAKSSSGQNGAPNVNFYADVPTSPAEIIDGTYKCSDTVHDTWSYNTQSVGGFCIVYAVPAVAPGTPASTTTTTKPFPNPTRTGINNSVKILLAGAFLLFVIGLLYWIYLRREPSDPAATPDPEGSNNNDDTERTEETQDGGLVGPDPPLSTEEGAGTGE